MKNKKTNKSNKIKYELSIINYKGCKFLSFLKDKNILKLS